MKGRADEAAFYLSHCTQTKDSQESGVWNFYGTKYRKNPQAQQVPGGLCDYPLMAPPNKLVVNFLWKT
ncbi:MAG: hypothetical protein LBR96_04845, partial [Treponema sp.]|nr:hypothetical protein [Treponema sp.]